MKKEEMYYLLLTTGKDYLTVLFEGTIPQIIKMRNQKDKEWKKRGGKITHHPQEEIDGSKLRFSSYFDDEGDLIGGLIIASKKELNKMVESGHLEKKPKFNLN